MSNINEKEVRAICARIIGDLSTLSEVANGNGDDHMARAYARQLLAELKMTVNDVEPTPTPPADYWEMAAEDANHILEEAVEEAKEKERLLVQRFHDAFGPVEVERVDYGHRLCFTFQGQSVYVEERPVGQHTEWCVFGPRTLPAYPSRIPHKNARPGELYRALVYATRRDG